MARHEHSIDTWAIDACMRGRHGMSLMQNMLGDHISDNLVQADNINMSEATVMTSAGVQHT